MKTVTVRIPVAVDKNGMWSCCAYSCYVDAKNTMFSVEALGQTEGHSESSTIVWITAEVPVPEPTEVQGRVE